jgi:hypothetical protein
MNGTDSARARAFEAIGGSAFTRLRRATRILWSTTHAESLFEHDGGLHVQAPDMILIKHSSIYLRSIKYLFGWDLALFPPKTRAGPSPGQALGQFYAQSTV